MGKYIGYATGGTYGYKKPSGSTGGEDSSNHYFAGIYGENNAIYYSIVHFPVINETNKNLVIQNAKVRIKSNSGGPCTTAQVWITSSSDRYSNEGVLAATGQTITISDTEFTTINLNKAGCEKIAECHLLGIPFYLRFTSSATERYRFVGYKNYAYSDVDNYGAPRLEFDYNYGSSTGILSSSSITLGNSISLTVESLSTNYTHKIDWYLNNQRIGTQNQTGSGSPGNFSYPIGLATNSYFSPTSSISQGKVILTTEWNNTTIGTATYYFTVNIGDNALPTIDKPSFVFKSPSGVNQSFCLQNYSSVYCTTKATPNGGASITNYQVTITGQASGNFSFSSALLERKLDISLSKSGSITVTIIATDSRGKTVTSSNSFTVTAYAPPSITSINFYRCNSSGIASAEGTYIMGTASYTFSAVHNNSITLSEKKINGANNSNITLNSTNKQISLTIYSIGSSLATIKITIQDSFGSSSSREFSIPGINYLMHFRDGAIGIGSPASNDNSLTIGWPVEFANGYLNNVPARNLILPKATWFSNGVNNETYDIIFERPDDGIYEGRIDIINESYRFYAYHKDMSDPIQVMYLNIPNSRLEVREITLTTALSPAYGGTGYTSLQATRNAMGLGNTSGALPIENGGTGKTTAADALKNLGIIYQSTKPAEDASINGKIWLQPITT